MFKHSKYLFRSNKNQNKFHDGPPKLLDKVQITPEDINGANIPNSYPFVTELTSAHFQSDIRNNSLDYFDKYCMLIYILGSKLLNKLNFWTKYNDGAAIKDSTGPEQTHQIEVKQLSNLADNIFKKLIEKMNKTRNYDGLIIEQTFSNPNISGEELRASFKWIPGLLHFTDQEMKQIFTMENDSALDKDQATSVVLSNLSCIEDENKFQNVLFRGIGYLDEKNKPIILQMELKFIIK